MKYNEKVERFAPELGIKNLANGLSCPPFVYMAYSEDGMWVHYCKYCENIAKQKYKRCLAMARLCGKTVDHLNSEGYIYEKENHTKELTDCIRGTEFYDKWYHRWLELAEKFKPNNSTAQ